MIYIKEKRSWIMSTKPSDSETSSSNASSNLKQGPVGHDGSMPVSRASVDLKPGLVGNNGGMPANRGSVDLKPGPVGEDGGMPVNHATVNSEEESPGSWESSSKVWSEDDMPGVH